MKLWMLSGLMVWASCPLWSQQVTVFEECTPTVAWDASTISGFAVPAGEVEYDVLYWDYSAPTPKTEVLATTTATEHKLAVPLGSTWALGVIARRVSNGMESS
ncbi:MAG: hypothetical protein ACR2P5_07680, partial [Gammaproteobacteria bacterium]